MSDYFLNKLYDSLLRRKQPKTKSTFRTLSESYNLVYEEDQEQEQQKDIPFKIHEYQQGSWTAEQRNLYLPGNTPAEPTSEIPAEYNPEITPGTKMTGVGPGECSVASLVSGLTDFASCRKMISGQKESFDVSWPNKDNSKYKFEVKKIEGASSKSRGSVRIAKHGANFTNEVIKDVTELLTPILDEYDILDENSKKEVDAKILASLPELKETRKDDREKKLHRIGWSVGRWIRGILANTRELPFTVLFSEKEPIFKRKEDETAPSARVLISVKTFSEFIENAKKGLNDETENLGTNDTDNERVKELKTKFKEFYGTPDTEKAPVLHKEIDKTAETVDKKLTKLKIIQTGEGKSTTEDFLKAISKLKLSDKLNNIKEKIESDASIKGLFPKGLTGLFIVDIKGYHYIPYDDLSKYIEVEKISSGGPKIRFR
jgi:hypothetical protein